MTSRFLFRRARRCFFIVLAALSSSVAAQTSTNLRVFAGVANGDGGGPEVGAIFSGMTLCGTTYSGTNSTDAAPSGCGTVFRMNTDGSDYAVLKQFDGTNGMNPTGGLVLSGNELYGCTVAGGVSNYGTVFRLNTDGSGFTVLHEFTIRSNGAYPRGGVVLSGDTLFGTTTGGGDAADGGTVFKLNTNGTGFTVLKRLNEADGVQPLGGLAVCGQNIFGITSAGGSLHWGSVFRIRYDGNGFTVLKEFGPISGSPRGALVVRDGIVFGTTVFGGSNHCGTVFSVRTNGTGYAVLKEFVREEAAYPFGGLALFGDTLFVMTQRGGGSDAGTLFSVKTDGSGFKLLKEFSFSEGQWPQTRMLSVGGKLFGATTSGGDWDRGVIFSLSVDGLLKLSEPQLSGTNFLVSFLTVTNTVYTLEYKDALESAVWLAHHSHVGDGSIQRCSIPITSSAPRFFRVSQP